MTSTTYCMGTNVRTNTTVNACFAYYFERLPTKYEAEQINTLLEKCTAEMICAVIEYTMQSAPKPSWAYAKTVCLKQTEMGNTTPEAFSLAVLQFRMSRYSASGYKPQYYKRMTMEQNYAQREYDPAKVNGPSAADLEEARKL